jgi:hypothetical protein
MIDEIGAICCRKVLLTLGGAKPLGYSGSNPRGKVDSLRKSRGNDFHGCRACARRRPNLDAASADVGVGYLRWRPAPEETAPLRNAVLRKSLPLHLKREPSEAGAAASPALGFGAAGGCAKPRKRWRRDITGLPSRPSAPVSLACSRRTRSPSVRAWLRDPPIPAESSG